MRGIASRSSGDPGPSFDDTVIAVLREAVDAIVVALVDHQDWGLSGLRPGQYASDLVADRAGVEVLHRHGLRVLSEESGLDPGDGPIAVIDPIDGSTNAGRKLPWFATSICVADSDGARTAVVHDHASGTRFEAVRGRGARRDGMALARRSEAPVPLVDAIIGVNGQPPRPGGWAQFRCLGAAALDLCAVAEGRLDGYVDFSTGGLGSWDYLGAMLVCQEVGISVRDGLGRDLVTLDPEARRHPVAGPGQLLDDLSTLWDASFRWS